MQQVGYEINEVSRAPQQEGDPTRYVSRRARHTGIVSEELPESAPRAMNDEDYDDGIQYVSMMPPKRKSRIVEEVTLQTSAPAKRGRKAKKEREEVPFENMGRDPRDNRPRYEDVDFEERAKQEHLDSLYDDDYDDDYEDEIVEISCSSRSNESQMERLTQIYDVLTMVGIDVPNEFAFSSEDEPEYMVVVDSNKNLHHTSSSSYRKSQGLEIGDIVELDRTFPYEYSFYRGDSYYSPLFVVVETDGINAKLAQCSDVKLTYKARSIYDRNSYDVKFNQDKYDDALKGIYDKEEMQNINLLRSSFKVVTKDFRLTETFNKIYRNRF